MASCRAAVLPFSEVPEPTTSPIAPGVSHQHSRHCHQILHIPRNYNVCKKWGNNINTNSQPMNRISALHSFGRAFWPVFRKCRIGFSRKLALAEIFESDFSAPGLWCLIWGAVVPSQGLRHHAPSQPSRLVELIFTATSYQTRFLCCWGWQTGQNFCCTILVWMNMIILGEVLLVQPRWVYGLSWAVLTDADNVENAAAGSAADQSLEMKQAANDSTVHPNSGQFRCLSSCCGGPIANGAQESGKIMKREWAFTVIN